MIGSLYDKFVDYSMGGSVWIISDTHFDDKDCLYMDENWPTPEKYIKTLYSFVHNKYDTLLHLGDVGNPKYLESIPARKILILGNHDKGKNYYKEWFDEVYDGPIFIGKKILLSHEPIYGLPFCINIHGHNHNSPETDIFHKNCAANIMNYKPMNLGKEIKKGLLAKAVYDYGLNYTVIDDKFYTHRP
ncbi:MAG: metallophosphoesterase family protein [Lachnospiraceae bacterium]|nr:metallophosphoesterase family protein [Lachnospiraceae bacterium]